MAEINGLLTALPEKGAVTVGFELNEEDGDPREGLYLTWKAEAPQAENGSITFAIAEGH